MATLGWGSSVTGSNITDIGEVVSVGFSLSTEAADTTSTASKFSASIPTTIQANSIFISCLFDGKKNGEVQKFVQEFKAKRTSTWTINFNPGIFTAIGYVSNVTVAAPHDHVVRMDISITLTGEPTFTGG